MADKLLRDELLRSHRYQSVSNDTAKLLFVHLTLSSDSLSNAEATTTALSIIMGRTITEEASATLLAELADRDLIRVYQADGKRYVHIPRSRQRIRYLRGKHPRPPKSIEDKEITELIEQVGLKSDRGQTEVTRSVAVAVAMQSSTDELSTGPHEPETPAKTWSQHWKSRAKALGINARPGESEKQWLMRAVEQDKRRRA